MEKEQLLQIVLDQRERFFAEKTLIERDLELEPYLTSKQIVVISGIRRCGKSSLLYLIWQKIKLEQNDCLYCNFDDERLTECTVADLDLLYQLHLEYFRPSHTSLLTFFLDEIQNIPGWERFLSRMYENGYKIYVTGSNARLLSSEIASALTGRNLVIHLNPFSFREYLRFNQIEPTSKLLPSQEKALLQGAFRDYFQLGGFPLMLEEKNPEILQGYYQDIVFRDIVGRHHTRQVDELRRMGLYLLSNIGKLFSIKTLEQVTGLKSTSSVKQFLDYFEAAFIFHYVRKYDYSIKKQILNPRKVYACDIGLARQIGFRFSEDTGRLLENVVFLELLRKNNQVFYFSDKQECDFICVQNDSVVQAIQVAYSLSDPETKRRELEGLTAAARSNGLNTALLLSWEGGIPIEIEGIAIEHLPVWQWLLG